MIFRLSQKLNSKIKAGALQRLPLDENPFADWSVHLFAVGRNQYILLSNTPSLYSTVIYAKGITTEAQFIQQTMNGIRKLMERDGHVAVYEQFVAPSLQTIRFAKSLNRSITGSINEIVAMSTQVLNENGSLERFCNRKTVELRSVNSEIERGQSMPGKKATPSEEPTQSINFDAAKKGKLLAENAAALAEFAATALIAAKQLGIKTKPLEHFTLSPAQREVLLAVPGISNSIKAKLAKKMQSYTVAEVTSMTTTLAEMPIEDDPRKQIAILLVAKHLTERLQAGIAQVGNEKLNKAKEPKTKTAPNTIYQFKITMLGSKPPIWRRIQVADCTLDKLHEHIQTAMGWTNSHLHRFEIGKKQYADPMLMEEDMEEFGYIDSTRTKIIKIMPKDGKRLSFKYEYDFGDCWEHEILFEGCPTKEPGMKYPLCLEGERACPPEDCSGVRGFHTFIKAIKNPKNRQHARMLEWSGGFDPERFDTGEATKAMKKGLPDWRNE